MALKLNISVSLASQIYISIVGVIALPILLKLLGPETYGLIGFFATLQAVFAMLDLGLTPTAAREASKFRANRANECDHLALMKSIEFLFFLIAVIGLCVLLMSVNGLAKNWLDYENLTIGEVQYSLRMIAFIIVIRWMTGFYRSILSGHEQIVFISFYYSFFQTTKFIFVIPYLLFTSTTAQSFFQFQLTVSIVEIAGLAFIAYKHLPNVKGKFSIFFDYRSLKTTWKFSLTIATTAIIWVAITQSDKLLLSKYLTLQEYGYFSLAVAAAAGILLISGSISGVIMPRLTVLEASNNKIEFERVYRMATRFVTIGCGSLTVVMAIFSKEFLYVWTNDPIITQKMGKVFTLYTMGNLCAALSAFAYYLQYAKGDLSKHLYFNLCYVVFLLPVNYFAIRLFGATGSATVWLSSNILFLLFWVGYIHSIFQPNLKIAWLKEDVLQLLIVPTFALIFLRLFYTFSTIRLVAILELLIIFFLALLIAIASDKNSRVSFYNRFI